MPKYRKISDLIDAIKWTGENWHSVFQFITDPKGNMQRYAQSPDKIIKMTTDTTEIDVSRGDFIIRAKGELDHCKPDIFAQTYELAE